MATLDRSVDPGPAGKALAALPSRKVVTIACLLLSSAVIFQPGQARSQSLFSIAHALANHYGVSTGHYGRSSRHQSRHASRSRSHERSKETASSEEPPQQPKAAASAAAKPNDEPVFTPQR
jgi:hypothetical protein